MPISGDMPPLPPPTALAALAAALAAADRPPLAPSTARAYRADWADVAAWCDQHGLVSPLAKPLTVRGSTAHVCGRLVYWRHTS